MNPGMCVVAALLELLAVNLPGMGFVGPAFACYFALALQGGDVRLPLGVVALAIGLRTVFRGLPDLPGRLREALMDLLPAAAGVGAASCGPYPALAGLQAYLLVWWLVPPLLARGLPAPALERWTGMRGRLFPLTIATAFCGVALAELSGWRALWMLPVLLVLRTTADMLGRGEEAERRLCLSQSLAQAETRLDAAAEAQGRLRDDLRGKVEEYILLEDLAVGLSRATAMARTLELVLAAAQRLTAANTVAVFLKQENSGPTGLVPTASVGAERDRVLNSELLGLMEPLVDDAWQKGEARSGRPLLLADPHAMAMPLATGGDRGGVLLVGLARPLTRQQERLLGIVAGQAAVAIESAFRWDATQAALTEQTRLHGEATDALRRLEASESQLVQSTKMAAVGQLAAGVAHELNTPLGAIYLAMDMAKRMLPDQWEKAVERLTKGMRSVKRAQEIIERLLYYSRDASKGRVATDVGAIARDAVDLLEHQLNLDGVRVELDIGEAPLVYCNQHEIYQVLTNLLLNARDALVASHRTEHPIRLQLTSTETDLSIDVIDRGPPISAAVQARVFEPFFTTKAVGEGTGLGLSVSAEIVEQHGGTLTLDASEARGTVFTVRLPLDACREEPNGR